MEYAINSRMPNGDKNKIESGWISDNPGIVDIIAANPNPVDHAMYSPHIIPAPGINIGNVERKLFTKIPIPSVSSITDKNSLLKLFASS